MNNVQSNTQAQQDAAAKAALMAKLDRAANSKNGRHVILDSQSAADIYNMDEFNPRGEFKGWMTHSTLKSGRCQIAMDVRKDQKIVIWAM